MNDEESLKILTVKYTEQRKKIEETLKTREAQVNMDIQRIEQQNMKAFNEITEETKNKVNVINANTDLKENEIMAEANMIRTEMQAQGEKDAATTRAEAEAFCVNTISTAKTQASQSIGQAIMLEGQAENEKLRGAVYKRRHMEAMKNLEATDYLSANRHLNLFTKDQDYLMALQAQKEAMKMIK
jgi:hypothetical protein